MISYLYVRLFITTHTQRNNSEKVKKDMLHTNCHSCNCRAGKVKSLTPVVLSAEKKKKLTGRAKKRQQLKRKPYNQQNATCGGVSRTILEKSNRNRVSFTQHAVIAKEILEIKETGQKCTVTYEKGIVTGYSYRNQEGGRKKQEGIWKESRKQDRLEKELCHQEEYIAANE